MRAGLEGEVDSEDEVAVAVVVVVAVASVGARNSLFELVGATDLSRTIGALDEREWPTIQQLAAKQRAMLVALLRG